MTLSKCLFSCLTLALFFLLLLTLGSWDHGKVFASPKGGIGSGRSGGRSRSSEQLLIMPARIKLNMLQSSRLYLQLNSGVSFPSKMSSLHITDSLFVTVHFFRDVLQDKKSSQDCCLHWCQRLWGLPPGEVTSKFSGMSFENDYNFDDWNRWREMMGFSAVPAKTANGWIPSSHVRIMSFTSIQQ